MIVTAIDASNRLECIANKLMIPKFDEVCGLAEKDLERRNYSPFRLPEDFVGPIANFADVLETPDFPNDTEFYQKLFSFTSPKVLLGFKSALKLSVNKLRNEGNVPYNVPEDNLHFFREYAFIAFI